MTSQVPCKRFEELMVDIFKVMESFGISWSQLDSKKTSITISLIALQGLFMFSTVLNSGDFSEVAYCLTAMGFYVQVNL